MCYLQQDADTQIYSILERKISALVRVTQSALFLYIFKESDLKVSWREAKRVREVLKAIK